MFSRRFIIQFSFIRRSIMFHAFPRLYKNRSLIELIFMQPSKGVKYSLHKRWTLICRAWYLYVGISFIQKMDRFKIFQCLPNARRGQSRVIVLRNFQVPSSVKNLKILKENDSKMSSVGVLKASEFSRPRFHAKMKSLYKYDLILVDPKKSFYTKRYYVTVVTKFSRLKIAPKPCFIP